jgi:hypothetical protein
MLLPNIRSPGPDEAGRSTIELTSHIDELINAQFGHLYLALNHRIFESRITFLSLDLESLNTNVQKVIHQVRTRAQSWENSSLRIEEREQKECLTGPSPFTLTLQTVYRVLGTIVDRPWFFRVWVLQEVALARNPIIPI